MATPVGLDYVKKLAPYIPGKPIEDVALELDLDPSTIVKLASNENPRGPSPKVLAAIAAAAADPPGKALLLPRKMLATCSAVMAPVPLLAPTTTATWAWTAQAAPDSASTARTLLRYMLRPPQNTKSTARL